MTKNKIIRRLFLLVSVIMLLTSTVNTTFGFIITKTNSLINTFVPYEKAVSKLLITKNVEHNLGSNYVIPDNITFDFKVDLGTLYSKSTIKTSNGNFTADEKGIIPVSVKPGKSIEIDGIDAGTKIKVTEVQKEGSGFAVKDGNAIKEGIVADDGSLAFKYVNVYNPAKVSPVNVYVEGKKILEGRDWKKGDTFSFKLEQKQIDGTWKVIDTKSVTYSADLKNFNCFDFNNCVHSLVFSDAGIYSFRISEVIGNLENMSYDKSINTFDIRVTDVDMDGKLEIGAVTAAQNGVVTKENGKFKINVTFNNTFKPAIPEYDENIIDINIKKSVKNVGDGLISAEGFEFILENSATGEKLSTAADKNGDAKISVMFSASDIGKTYNYKLYEVNSGINGVVYDTTVYDISVTVDRKDNKLTTNVLVNGKDIEKTPLQFLNIYDSKNSQIPSTGDKSNITFWFIMMLISGSVCVVLIIMEKRYRKG